MARLFFSMCIVYLVVEGSIQLVGMSATLSNTAELASFMRAQVYSSTFRPVSLYPCVRRCVRGLGFVGREGLINVLVVFCL